ncbi:MAG: hypothetical protein QOH19_1542 [Actinomycetota bacterium]|jgi:hypothetical protein|nr:hypothetical protein [Actinomycetota bacterium]
MLGALGKIRRRFDWDVMVGVTDLPIRFESRTLVVEMADAQPIALVSLPALGAVNIHRRVSATVAGLRGPCMASNRLGPMALAGRNGTLSPPVVRRR